MNMQPIAQSLAAQGRQGDTMLVHMTPGEVGGLQALAQHMGGSLTTNPATGLPEANFLRAILPTVLGLGITAATGGAAAPWMIGAGVGGGTALLTGDLQQGLMAGLGAFGGAGLGSTLMGMGANAAGSGAMQALGDEAVKSGLMGSGANIASAAPVTAAPPLGFQTGLRQMGAGVGQAFQNPGSFGSQLVSNLGGPLGAGAAGLGLASGFGAFDQPSLQTPAPAGETSSNYAGPYRPTDRQVRFPTGQRPTSSAEFQYFNDVNPRPGFQPFAEGGEAELLGRAIRMPSEEYRAGEIDEFDHNFRPVEVYNPRTPSAEPQRSTIGGKGAIRRVLSRLRNPNESNYVDLSDFRYDPGTQRVVPMAQGGLAALAAGGEMLEDGSFVIDARTVAELGNGSSNAGMELLMQLGGRPVQGPGDGVSDSIPATIEGEQAAAVARDEVIFDPEAVARIGDGDPKKGTERLYQLMRMAEEARKDVDRGEDSGVAEGLGALAPEMGGMGGMGGMDQMMPMGV